MDEGVKIMPMALICEDVILRGDITISKGCVLHPRATIIAESGPLVLGENCIVEEYATIIYRIPKQLQKNNEDNQLVEKPPLIIGSSNVFEVGSRIEALKIGDKNVFECKSYVSPLVSVTNGCVIGAGCKLEAEQILPENTVIYGENCLQREALDKHGSHTMQIDFLRKILPTYHHIRKSNH